MITIELFERIGLLLVAAFIVTRIPSFRLLLDREVHWQTSFYYSIVFAMFSIAGSLAGVGIKGSELTKTFWFPNLDSSTGLAHSGIVGIVMAGLLGGPIVGLGAGLLAGVHFYLLGGTTALAFSCSSPFIGLFAGFSARFFSNERIISPVKSFFIGMFATILSMCFVLILTTPPREAIEFVNTAGVPMVITNSIAIAIFTTMIRVVLTEKDQAQAIETKRALHIAELVLPYLKQGVNYETAKSTAGVLMSELGPAAVAVTDTHKILAHLGQGAEHHSIGTPLRTKSSKDALESGAVQIVTDQSQIQCSHKKCPLKAAILVPFVQSGEVAGLIKLYYRRPQQIRAVDIALAQGLGKLISNQLTIAEAERLLILMKDAELRTLQAQVNPHFLFNTLNSIVSLIRIDPSKARFITIQLAHFMRTNLKILAHPLIPLDQELKHLQAYIDIVNIRFDEQLSIQFDVEPTLPYALIPPSTIQPLVENSIEHGLKTKGHNRHIIITAKKAAKHIYLSVEDNGTGIHPEVISKLGQVPIKDTLGNGVGVYNVNQRLIALLGHEAKLHIVNKPRGGCSISFFIPIQEVETKTEEEQNEI